MQWRSPAPPALTGRSLARPSVPDLIPALPAAVRAFPDVAAELPHPCLALLRRRPALIRADDGLLCPIDRRPRLGSGGRADHNSDRRREIPACGGFFGHAVSDSGEFQVDSGQFRDGAFAPTRFDQFTG
ncbi:Fatty acyl-CoA reductase 3 [Hordeum vulgare]|nr:Fatty acyl-CoA reductase 3 [Hordeum vulgare]